MTADGPLDVISTTLELARKNVELGRLMAASIRTDYVLMLDPANEQATALRGLIAQKLNLTLASPGASHYGPPIDPDRPRFMLIKSFGVGFWGDMNHVFGALLTAEISGRIPVVHWGPNCLYSNGVDEAFAQFWRPVSAYSLEDVAKAAEKGGVYPPKWTPKTLADDDVNKWDGEYSRLADIYLLNRPEAVVVSDFYTSVADLLGWIPQGHPMHGKPFEVVMRHLADRYLQPHPEVMAQVERFAAKNFAGREVLAVHIRGSDKRFELHDMDKINQAYLPVLAAEPPMRWFFVLSDDQRWVDKLKAQPFGGRIICTESHRTDSDNAPHFRKEFDRLQVGREVMVDTYLAMRCGGFLGFAFSNVSDIISVLEPWPLGTCRLFGDSGQARDYFYLYPADDPAPVEA